MKEKLNIKLRKGFTLIELLVVIAIIGILAALSLVSYTTSQRQARDAQRKSDLKQYSTAIEAFANSTGGLYPCYPSGTSPSASLCGDLGLTNCPSEPSGTTEYQYISGDGAAGTTTCIKYILSAELESSNNFYLVCSNGKNGIFASEPGTPDCPI